MCRRSHIRPHSLKIIITRSVILLEYHLPLAWYVTYSPCCVHAVCYTRDSACLARLLPELAVVWRERLRRKIWTDRPWFIHTLDSADTTSGSTRVAARWTLRLTLYSRYNSVVWKTHFIEGQFWSLLPVGIATRLEVGRQREKLSYCQGTVELVVHPWFRLLYEFAELIQPL